MLPEVPLPARYSACKAGVDSYVGGDVIEHTWADRATLYARVSMSVAWVQRLCRTLFDELT